MATQKKRKLKASALGTGLANAAARALGTSKSRMDAAINRALNGTSTSKNKSK